MVSWYTSTLTDSILSSFLMILVLSTVVVVILTNRMLLWLLLLLIIDLLFVSSSFVLLLSSRQVCLFFSLAQQFTFCNYLFLSVFVEINVKILFVFKGLIWIRNKLRIFFYILNFFKILFQIITGSCSIHPFLSFLSNFLDHVELDNFSNISTIMRAFEDSELRVIFQF